METALHQTANVLICLVIVYLVSKLVFRAYFSARRDYVLQLLDKAKEIKSGKEG